MNRSLEPKLYFACPKRLRHEVHCKKSSDTHPMATTFSRRTFIKTSLIGAVALAAAGGLYRGMKNPAAPEAFILDGEAKAALAAIASIMLQDALPSSSPQSMEVEIARIQSAIASLPRTTQSEIQDLFGLLSLAPARRFLAGIPAGWAEAKPEEIAAFLQSWRVHRFAMLQSAYHALHDLIIGAWYADESTWESIGYPGPIKELS